MNLDEYTKQKIQQRIDAEDRYWIEDDAVPNATISRNGASMAGTMTTILGWCNLVLGGVGLLFLIGESNLNFVMVVLLGLGIISASTLFFCLALLVKNSTETNRRTIEYFDSLKDQS